MLTGHFHFRNGILVNCFFTKWKYIYRNLEVKSTQYGICWISDLQKTKGNDFVEVGQGGQKSLVGSINSLFLFRVAPARIYLPKKLVGRGLPFPKVL